MPTPPPDTWPDAPPAAPAPAQAPAPAGPPTSTPQGLHTLSALCAGRLQGTRTLDLRHAGLRELPSEVLGLADTLEVLDLSGNALQALPEGFARLQRLHTVFGSANRFEQLPPVLGRLPQLDTVGFRANRIAELPAAALPPRLRWLILTDNALDRLPEALGACGHLQKLMLAGNRLRALPAGLGGWQRLELLRLAANRFDAAAQALPPALLALPRLAWLAFGGNPFTADAEAAALAAAPVPAVPWSALRVGPRLGEGASGQIHAADWPGGGLAGPLALKLFKGALISDGWPHSEAAAAAAAGDHPHLVGALGRLSGHPQGLSGLLLPRLSAAHRPLAAPPSMASCSRDVYAPGLRLTADQARQIAQATAQALQHLHARGLVHGDLYAHNTLLHLADPVDPANPPGPAAAAAAPVAGPAGLVGLAGVAQQAAASATPTPNGLDVRLSDFGAASFAPPDGPGAAGRRAALQALDWRAHRVLVDELAAHCAQPEALSPWRC